MHHFTIQWVAGKGARGRGPKTTKKQYMKHEPVFQILEENMDSICLNNSPSSKYSRVQCQLNIFNIANQILFHSQFI